MAKKDKAGNGGDQEGKKGSKIITALIILFILILWVGIFSIIIKLDVAGLGSSLRPALKDIPVVNKILPEVSEEQLAWEEDYPYTTLSEAVNQIKVLELELDQARSESKDYDLLIAELQAEIDRLKVFEEEQLAFEERVKEFDKYVVFNDNAPGLDAYKQYYEEINPTTAEEIYRVVLEQLQYDEGIQEKAKILKTMKPSQAALVLEQMTADIEWIAKVLLCMKAEESAAIFNKMDELYSAKILKKMADMDEEKLQSIMNSLQ